MIYRTKDKTKGGVEYGDRLRLIDKPEISGVVVEIGIYDGHPDEFVTIVTLGGVMRVPVRETEFDCD